MKKIKVEKFELVKVSEKEYRSLAEFSREIGVRYTTCSKAQERGSLVKNKYKISQLTT